MPRLRSSRGQESAPFELLIAVIIMSFVMLLGYRAITEVKTEECKLKIDRQLERMRNAIERTTNQASLERITFEIPQCFKNDKVKLSTVYHKNVCSSFCQEGKRECVLLDYWSDEYYSRVCINIPVHTEFEGAGGGFGTYCGPKEDYVLTSFTDEGVGVPNGTYVLMNRTQPGSSKEVVCAYRMEG